MKEKKIEIIVDGNNRTINTYNMDMGEFTKLINELYKAVQEGNYSQRTHIIEGVK